MSSCQAGVAPRPGIYGGGHDGCVAEDQDRDELREGHPLAPRPDPSVGQAERSARVFEMPSGSAADDEPKHHCRKRAGRGGDEAECWPAPPVACASAIADTAPATATSTAEVSSVQTNAGAGDNGAAAPAGAPPRARLCATRSTPTFGPQAERQKSQTSRLPPA